MKATNARPQPQPDIPEDQIPARVLERLTAEGIRTLADWRRLTRRARRSIFGITRATVEQLDELARTVQT